MVLALGLWNFALGAMLTGGAITVVSIICAAFWMQERESRGRPILPFGARMRVERAKAHTEVLGEQLKAEALEVKRLAIDHQRTRVMAAIQADDHETVALLGLPSASKKAEDAEWRASR